ncbi:MAG: hypothetical protein WC008_03465 [Bacilli bacterium]
MKKINIIILIILLFSLSGCFKNKVTPNEGEIVLRLEEKYTALMPYEKSDIPIFRFEFDGVFNTIMYVSKTFYSVFATNDDFLLSAEIERILNENEGRVEYVVSAQDVQTTTRINSMNSEGKQVANHYPVDNSDVFDETAFIDLENGLKLSIDYRRFSSDGKTYYVWRYSQNLAMYLYYPLMVIEENGQKELLILTLPNQVKFQVGTTLSLDKILDNDDYLDVDKYTFNYLDRYTSLSEKKQHIIDYYVDGYEGVLDDNTLYFNYLNIKFKLTLLDDYFTIEYDSKLDALNE